MIEYKRPLELELSCDDLDRPLVNLVNEASVKMSLVPSADILELLERQGFTRRGKFSWSLGINDNGTQVSRFFKEYSEDFLPLTMISSTNQVPGELTQNSPLTGYFHEGSQKALSNDHFMRDINAYNNVSVRRSDVPKEYITTLNSNRYNRDKSFLNDYKTLGGVDVTIKNDVLWVRLFPTKTVGQWSDRINMPKVKNVLISSSVYFPPRKILEFMEEMEDWGKSLWTSESAEVDALLEQTKNVVSVGYSPNQPATVLLYRGVNVRPAPRSRLHNYPIGKEKKVSLDTVLELQQENKKIDFLVHDALSDVFNMSKAKSYMGEKRLKSYQKKAVGLHLATKIGYLQSCSPGMGKTVIQLVAMRARSEEIPNYRGLIVCEANVRDQWEEETHKWFPDATAIVIRSLNDFKAVTDALSKESPVVIILSYSHTLLAYDEREKRKEEALRLRNMNYFERLREMQEASIPELTLGSILLDYLWNDICADEAVIIRNGTSKQSSILWDLRKNSDVATALTATPINKSPDDIGRLIAWVRNDRNLFTGAPLSKQYDTSDAEEARRLFKVLGPLVFRRDTSEISDDLPTAKQEVFLMKPSPAELALATAAEKELKRCYLELVSALEEVEKTETTNKEELQKIKANLKQANGAWLGGTQLARMATSDPSALLGSTSVGAALLMGQGLVQEAMLNEPTKRVKFIEEAQKRIINGQQMIVFTEFATVAESLEQALQDNGINAKSYTGKNGAVRDRSRKEFQDGKVDVLVCTRAAERGLTLHKASAIYHYDLPWTLEKIIQRTGRTIRIGSENASVDVVFMIMEGTIEQRMANHLVELGMSASLVMDNSRGIELKNTETASAMGGLMAAMSKTSKNNNVVEFGKLLLGI